MNKKIISFIILLISLIGIFYYLHFSFNSVYFSNVLISENNYQSILDSYYLNEQLLPENLEFNGYKLFFDKTTKTYFYSVVDGDNNYQNPEISWQGNTVIKLSTYEINEYNIKNNIPIKGIIYNDSEYNTFNISITTLPIIDIELTESSEKLWSDAKSVVTLFDNRSNAINRFTISEANVHVRGNTSLNYPKRSLKISFTANSLGNHERKNDISLLGLRKDDDYLLVASYEDKDNVRINIANDLWLSGCAENNSFDIFNGGEYIPVEVILNGEYYGLCSLTYPIDSKQLKLEDNETQYFMVGAIGTSDSAIETNEIKNGKVDYTALKKYYEICNRSSNKDELLSLVDVDNNIDIYLLYGLLQCVDNGMDAFVIDGETYAYLNNTYLTSKNCDGATKFLFTPWDMDNCFGKSFGGSYDSVNFTDNFLMPNNPIYSLLSNHDEEVIRLVKERYFNLRNNQWSDESINDFIDYYETRIFDSGANLRDIEKYPDGFNNYENNLNELREYITNRLAFFDEYIASLN